VFPNIFSLDLSFNNLSEIEPTLVWLRQLQSLKMLSLEGNPLVLTKNYTKIVTERVKDLKVFDGNTVFAD
jgi:hypothetical protein